MNVITWLLCHPAPPVPSARKTVLLGLNVFLTQKPLFGSLGLGLPESCLNLPEFGARQAERSLPRVKEPSRRAPARSSP